MAELRVSSAKNEYRATTCSSADSTTTTAGKIEIFPAGQQVEDTQNLPQGYSVERTTETETDANKKQAEISKLEKNIEKDIKALKELVAKQKAGIKGSWNRTEKQENALCWIGGGSIALGTIGTWMLDAKNECGGMLALFTGMGFLGGMLAAVIPVGITAYLMRSANKKDAENELQQSISQLSTKISQELELLKHLKESA